jgi:putative RNA 2'-phosphotransferase
VEDILKVVKKQKKIRFEFDPLKEYIRASYGHSDSSSIIIQYPLVIPPQFLFHGTSKRLYNNKISIEGIKKMSRQFVYMTNDIIEAKKVALRKTGENDILVLTIIAQKMHEDRYIFYNPSQNIWITEIVPPEYLQENS